MENAKQKKPSSLHYFLREITIVVIGVLIAVTINNYKERFDNNRFVESTLTAIENEVETNQTELDTVLKRHLIMVEKLEAMDFDKSLSLGDMIGELGGFQVASVRNISLRFFISNKAELLDYQLISQLTAIETQTGFLTYKIDRLADYVYKNMNDTTEVSKLTFTNILYDVIDSESNLLESYSQFLEENKAFLGLDE